MRNKCSDGRCNRGGANEQLSEEEWLGREGMVEGLGNRNEGEERAQEGWAGLGGGCLQRGWVSGYVWEREDGVLIIGSYGD